MQYPLIVTVHETNVHLPRHNWQKEGPPRQWVIGRSYLCGISHSWFLLKLMEVMTVFFAASKMSSGIKVACLSLSKSGSKNKSLFNIPKRCNHHCPYLKTFIDFTKMFKVADEVLWGQDALLTLRSRNRNRSTLEIQRLTECMVYFSTYAWSLIQFYN